MTLPARSLLVAVIAGSLPTSSCDHPSPARAPGVLRVAAASDLTDAFTELSRRWEARTGDRVALTFGSSGLLSRQIEEGAPFDLFASADVQYADRAARSGRCDATSRALYARGRLAVVTRTGLALPIDVGALRDARFTRVAIANPEHAPYGRAALEALTAAGAIDALGPRIVRAENVRQALQFVTSGNADAALVARALVAPGQSFLEVPASLHAPLEQALVTCGTSASQRARARGFADFVVGPEGRAELARRGFEVPPVRPR